jgi:glycosyltransferase involved in cell wall biosynthesis
MREAWQLSMRILAFPKDANPYQELLYGALRTMGNRVTYISEPTNYAAANAPFIIASLLMKRLVGYEIVHIHWTYTLSTTHRSQRALAFRYYRFLLWFIVKLGFKLVWTAHNILPHEAVFNDDHLAREYLLNKSDLVIFHDEGAVDRLRILGLSARRFVVIPHGNYVGSYKNTTSREDSREFLGISESAFVYLHIGFLRTYKGTDELINAFGMLPRDWNVVLVIAGQCFDSALRERIGRAVEQSDSTIVFRVGFVPDDDLQHYFAAADAVVLPFRSVSTSGSAILALSFERPIIVPTLGALESLPHEVTFAYDPADAHGLQDALEEAYAARRRLNSWPSSAIAFITSLSWEEIARQTEHAFRMLLP